jgi:hypothetical protein
MSPEPKKPEDKSGTTPPGIPYLSDVIWCVLPEYLTYFLVE